jgi:FtsP/CotA-like multicopper oxidase with cupredoxin domain
MVEAYAYNGVVPGPEIRVTQGDRVRVILTNERDEGTAIHWHGLIIPNAMDGVPFITQPPVDPGERFTYEFTAQNPGSQMKDAAATTLRSGLARPAALKVR